MGNHFFRFKQFKILQERDVMRVNTDSVILGAWTRFQPDDLILDLGTGTGIIALMLAQRGAKHIDAIDIDSEAFAQSVGNVSNSPWSESIYVAQSSFQAWSQNGLDKYDIIVSNPPYFNNALKSPLKRRSIIRHNDQLTHEDILDGLDACLKEEGRFVAIFPISEGSLFVVKAAERGYFCNEMLSISSQPNGVVKRIICDMSRSHELAGKWSLSIFNSDRQYSCEYKELTKEFFLDF